MRAVALGAAALALVLTMALAIRARHVLTAPAASSATEEVFEVTAGESLREVAERLEQSGLVRSALVFEAYARWHGLSTEIQTGRYRFAVAATPDEILDDLVSGRALSEGIRFTIPEGWSVESIAGAVEAAGFCSAAEFRVAAQMQDAYAEFAFLSSMSGGDSLEGFLFPDTYELGQEWGATDLVSRMLETFSQKVVPVLREDVIEDPRAVRDLVILSSIVQLEANGLQMEEVAGVFRNRLDAGMPLQSDATVNYVLGTSKRQPTIADTLVESPFNTYAQPGLPPGPIGNPGLDAIRAAARPGSHDYFYFLHKADGEIVLSHDFQEHVANKSKFLR